MSLESIITCLYSQHRNQAIELFIELEMNIPAFSDTFWINPHPQDDWPLVDMKWISLKPAKVLQYLTLLRYLCRHWTSGTYRFGS
jgi:hypothetical protein